MARLGRFLGQFFGQRWQQRWLAIASPYLSLRNRITAKLQPYWQQAVNGLYPNVPPLIQDWLRPPDIRRTPTLLQMEAVECGAASLGMILGYHQRIVALPELRQACGVSRDGSKASNVLNAAKRYHLDGKGFKVPLAQLAQLPRPFIVFWNFNHFLVVEGFHRGQVFINDPATGPRRISWTEFSEAFTGVVLTFQPGSEFEPGGAKPSVISALRKRLQGSIASFMFCLVVGFLLVLPGLAIPAFSKVFIDEVLIQGREDWLRPLVLLMIGMAGLTGLLTRLQLQVLRQLKIKLSMAMSSQFLWHILHLPVSFYDQRFAGEISGRIKLNDRLANLLSGELATTTISGVMVLFYGAVMLQYDWVLTLIGIASVGINLMAMRWVARQRSDVNTRLMQEQGKVSGVAIAGLQSMETLKASGLESDFFTKWAGYYAKSLNARQDMDGLAQRLSLVPSLLTGISTMLLLVVGGLRVMDGVLSIGMLVAFQSLIQQFTQPVNQLIKLGGDIQELEGTLNRLDDVLNNPTDPILQSVNHLQSMDDEGMGRRSRCPSYATPQSLNALTGDGGDRSIDPAMGYAVANPSYAPQSLNTLTGDGGDRSIDPAMGYAVANPSYAPNASTSQFSNGSTPQRSNEQWLSESRSPKLQGHLRIESLTFGYNLSAPPLIENFSLTLKPGQRVALVGGSGSGKSTVAKLVCGLYQPWSGEIYFDHIPRKEIPRPVLVNSLAMIEQDVLLFSGTVRDNLTLWDTTIPDANVVQACRDAAIHDVILTQPGGYDADLLEGATNLSGGQRQRLEIARSLVNTPSILVMDEATSALDTETERMIDYNLRLRGCTCLMVAHRLSTIRDCDEIIVMHRGTIAQRGTHEQLSQVDGPYLTLIRSEGA